MEKGYKNESYYDVTPISITSNLLDIADMLKCLRKPKIALLDDKNINELLYIGKIASVCRGDTDSHRSKNSLRCSSESSTHGRLCRLRKEKSILLNRLYQIKWEEEL